MRFLPSVTRHFKLRSLRRALRRIGIGWEEARQQLALNAFWRYGVVAAATMGIAAGTVPATTDASDRQAPRPNILFILGDDAGAEVFESYYTNPTNVADGQRIDTPNITRLAEQGLKFNSAIACPLCTPSRVQLLTGKYNFRNFRAFSYLDNTETTFAQLLQKAGYTTAVAGKWQLSWPANGQPPSGAVWGRVTPETIRDDYGFDHFLATGIARRDFGTRWKTNLRTASEDGQTVVDAPMEPTGYGPDRTAAFLEDVIARSAADGKPFLAYYTTIMPHAPNVPTPKSGVEDPASAKRGDEWFDDQVEYFDTLTGRLVARLDDPNGDGDTSDSVRENTLIIFTVDNGTDGPGDKIGASLHIRTEELGVTAGEKGHNSHLGTHVPMIMVWGDRLSGETDRPTDFSDIFPTLIELAGAEMPDDLVIDGKPVLDRTGKLLENREAVYNHYHSRGRPQFSEWFGEFAATSRHRLYDDGRYYDVIADPKEDHDLSKGELTEAQQADHDLLRKTLEHYAAEQQRVGSPMR